MNRNYTAIIPAFNSQDTIVQLLNSLIKLEFSPSEIIVVDDASTDHTQDLATQLEGVKVLRLKDNVGPGAARNIGANNAKTRWLLFIDSDCSLPLSSIENAFPTEIEEVNNIVGIMGVFAPTGPKKSPVASYKNMQRHHEIKAMRNPPETFSSSCFTITKEAYLICSGFNEAFGKIPTEDNEFYFRLSKKGFRIKYDTAFTFIHNKHLSIKGLFRDDYLRAKAIILNILGRLGEPRGALKMDEVIRWVLELSSGIIFVISLSLIAISLISFSFSNSMIFLLSAIFSAFIIGAINYKFLKHSFKCGGALLMTAHLFLRSIEMVAAVTGMSAIAFELLFKKAKYVSNNSENK